jgi:hypothetical protein
MKNLKAYHGSPEIKAKYLARVRRHREADELIKGQYWQHGKGCAVGCTLQGRFVTGGHDAYETDLGIPVALAHIEDNIFENLPNAAAQLWPERFLDAIRPGADLTGVADKFLLAVLVDEQHGVWRHADERGKQVIEAVAALLRRKIAGKTVTAEEWTAAAAHAYSAANAAYASSYAASYAARAAKYAAEAAAEHASFADAASCAADSAAPAYAAATSWQTDTLIDLLKAA